jgi:Tol biopolymer transport system component
LYIVDVRTGASHRILKWDYSGGGQPPLPAWSPDGQSLVFANGPAGHVEVISRDGSHARSVATLEKGGSATWSPDGRWIAYSETGFLDSRDGIYLVRPNGTDKHQITGF